VVGGDVDTMVSNFLIQERFVCRVVKQRDCLSDCTMVFFVAAKKITVKSNKQSRPDATLKCNLPSIDNTFTSCIFV
jgi:hypothetical protein